MCGIHGFINTAKKEFNADDFIRSSFVANSLRGMDSCGIASINIGKKAIDYQKLPVNGSTFIQDKYADNLIKMAREENVVTICHNRAATSGKVGYNQAHPFYVQDGEREIIGVHNGTLTGWQTKVGSNKFLVDSEWALNNIFDKGADAFKDFSGAYCFVWWDSADEGTLNIALNDQRPMCIAFTDNGNMAYASEAGMLYWLCERHNLKIKGQVLYLTSDKWYKFPANDPSKYTKSDLPKSTYIPQTTVNYTRYSTPSVVEKVDKLLEKISGQNSAPIPGTAVVVVNKKPNVTTNEVQNARDLGLMSKMCIFEPYWYDEAENCMLGIAYTEDENEFSATIRNSGDIDFISDGSMEWSCRIIGADDDGKELNLLCGQPTVRARTAQTRQTRAVH